MTTVELKLFQELKEKFGEAATLSLFQLVEEKASEKFNSQKDFFATKEDFRKLEREDTRLESVIKTEVARLEATIEKGFKEQLKWLIVLLMGFSSLIIAVIKLL